MKFLDARRAVKPENKMQPGSRPDQGGPSADDLAARRKEQIAQENKNSIVADAQKQVIDLAKELGVDLSAIKGSGADGRILVRDVRAAASKKGTDELPLSGRTPSEG